MLLLLDIASLFFLLLHASLEMGKYLTTLFYPTGFLSCLLMYYIQGSFSQVDQSFDLIILRMKPLFDYSSYSLGIISTYVFHS